MKCSRFATGWRSYKKGNLIKQGNVHELLRGSEQVLVRLNTLEETQQAKTILEAAKQQGADWMSEVHVQMDRQGQSTLLVDTAKSYSTEINAVLARNHLFAAELHPHEGSLEEVFLQLTTPLGHTRGWPLSLVEA